MYKTEIEKIKTCMRDTLHTENDYLKNIINHILDNSGKFIRSQIALSIGITDETIKLCCLIELLHTAMLLHDDVIDESKIRRNQSSVNHLFGEKNSILCGDYIYSKIFETISINDFYKLFSSTSSQASLSELLQQQYRYNTSIDLETYFKIIEGKTGALFSLTLECMAIIHNLDREKLKKIGLKIGFLYQIIDDLKDISNQDNNKEQFEDIKNGIITMPSILLKNHIKQKTLDQIIKNNDTIMYQFYLKKFNIPDQIQGIVDLESRYIIADIEQLPYNTDDTLYIVEKNIISRNKVKYG